MINKKNIWFLTLFSLILVLSIYYITMPSELLMTASLTTDDKEETTEERNAEKAEEKTEESTETEEKSEETITIEESEILTSLRVESNEKVMEEMEQLKAVLSDKEATTEEKNDAYEKMKDINKNRGKEEELEKKILDTYKLKSYVKIDGDEIRVVALAKEHDTKLANDIMRMIQELYETKMYISVQFQTES